MRKQQVLIAAIDLVPQAITDILFAILQNGSPMPDRVVIISTKSGREKLCAQLIELPRIKQFCQQFSLPEIRLAAQDIKVPIVNGEVIDEVFSSNAQKVMADFIVDEVRALTCDNACQVRASIAGGSKNMAFFLGYAMSLFGRIEDCLSYVNVAYAGNILPNFSYPIPSINSHKVAAENSAAHITLIELPFVRMRVEMPVRLIEAQKKQKNISYSEFVGTINLLNKQCLVVVDISKRSIQVEQVIFQVHPYSLAFYCWLCDRQNKNNPIISPSDLRYYYDNGVEFLSWLQLIDPEASPEEIESSLMIEEQAAMKLSQIDLTTIKMAGLNINTFNNTRSRMMRVFRANLGEALTERITPAKAQYKGGEFVIKKGGNEPLPYLINPEWCQVEIRK